MHEVQETIAHFGRAAEPQFANDIGGVEYQRPYGTCDRCGISYAPMDCGLGIPATGGSVTRTELVCHAALTAGAFGIAAEVLKKHDKIELSDQQIRRISEKEGKRLVQERRLEVESFRDGKPIAGPEKTPEMIVVVADGGRIQTRQPEEPQQSGKGAKQEDEKGKAKPSEAEESQREKKRGAWKEDMVGAVYEANPQKNPDARQAEEYDGAKAGLKTFVATLAGCEEFGWMLCVEAIKRGYAKAREKLFLSDGDPKLRTLRQTHFSDAVFILDWYHAAEHLSDCAKAAFGEATEADARWYQRIKAKLGAGVLDAVIGAIEKSRRGWATRSQGAQSSRGWSCTGTSAISAAIERGATIPGSERKAGRSVRAWRRARSSSSASG